MLFHLSNILLCPFVWRSSLLDGSILSRKTKRIKAHRMKNVKTLHPLITRYAVSEAIIAHMTHMQFSARIRKHLKAVEFTLPLLHLCFENSGFLPLFSPSLLDGLEINIFSCHLLRSSCYREQIQDLKIYISRTSQRQRTPPLIAGPVFSRPLFPFH